MSIEETVQKAYPALVMRLAKAGVASPQAEAWQLLEAATGASRGELLLSRRTLTSSELRSLGEWLGRRELREPLQLILGRAYFYGLEVSVARGVLIPRPETERLVEIALDILRDVPNPRVLDVGTGTGAVALAMKAERPDATVAASDIDRSALLLAERNARQLGLDILLWESDLLSHPEVAAFASGAQAIVSNPPYLPLADSHDAQPEVGWDPAPALYAGEDGLAVYHALARTARTLLQKGSSLIVELDPRNVDVAREQASGWESAAVHEDLAGRRRFLELRR